MRDTRKLKLCDIPLIFLFVRQSWRTLEQLWLFIGQEKQ